MHACYWQAQLHSCSTAYGREALTKLAESWLSSVLAVLKNL